MSVTFSIENQPNWASFNATTGELSGSPTTSNVGETANITITASNGTTSASIGPFDITVSAPPANPPPSTGIATLSWDAPILNTDGTALGDLAGYKIYYGTSASQLTQQITISGTETTSYVVSGLASGTYYFAVTAYASDGTESSQSNVASKTI
jgi:fibronectin type 3 domain-containing protein